MNKKKSIVEWSFLLFFISLYFENWKVPIFSNFLLTSRLQMFFIIVTILTSLFKKKRFIPQKVNNVGLLSTFVMYFLVVNVLSSVIYGGDVVNMALLSNFLTFLCLLNVFFFHPSLMRVTAIVNIIVMDIICLLALNGIGIDINTEFTMGEDRLRIFGLNPNGLSLYAALSSICCIYAFFKSSKKITKLLLIGSFFCCVELVIMSGSKGGLIYLFVCMVIMLGNTVRKSRNYMVLLIPIAIAFMYYLFSYIMGSDVFVERFAEDDISDGRFALFDRGIKVFLQSPIFGVGMSGYDYYMKFFFGQSRPTHNGYLDVAAYTGVVGLTLLFSYIYRQGKNILRIKKTNAFSVLFAVFLIFIMNFAKDGGVVFSKFTWIHIAVIISYTAFLQYQKVGSITYK